MITKEQKERIFYLAGEMCNMASAEAWEDSSYFSSSRAKAQAAADTEEARLNLEQYLDSIMA